MKPTSRITAGLVAAIVAIAVEARADAPALVPVQGYLTDTAGAPLNSQVAITFQLYDADTGGTVLHAETQAVDVANGAFTAYLGGGTQTLDLGIFTSDTVWLQITVGTERLDPRFRLATAPYAAFAQLCGDATSLGGLPPSAFQSTAGTGVTIDASGRVSVNQSTVEGYARGVAYDTEAELTALLNDNYTYTNGAGLSLAANQFSVNGVTSAMITDGTVALADLAASSVNSSKIVDGTIVAADLAAGAVTSAVIADGTINGVDISPGAIATLEIANNAVTSAKITDGTITGADIAPGADLTVDTVAASGGVTATAFTYSPAATETIYIDPATCQRSSGGVNPYNDLAAEHPNQNSYGPGLRLNPVTNPTIIYLYCPVPIVRRGGTITIVGATANLYDGQAGCLVTAELRTKSWGTIDQGTVIGTVFSGNNGTDYASIPGFALRAFPALSVALPQNSILMLVGTLASNAAGGQDCRFQGARIDYTTDRP